MISSSDRIINSWGSRCTRPRPSSSARWGTRCASGCSSCSRTARCRPRAARRDRGRGVEPVPAARRAAPGRPGHLVPRRPDRPCTRSRTSDVADLLAARRAGSSPTADRPGRPADELRAAGAAGDGGRRRTCARPDRRRCCRAAPTGRRCAAHPRRDLLAGLTVAIVALPLALAFGVTSGLGAAGRAGHRGRRRRGRRRLRRLQPPGLRPDRGDDRGAGAGRRRSSAPTGVLMVGALAGLLLIALAAGPARPLRALPARSRSSRASPPASPWSSPCSRCRPRSACRRRTGDKVWARRRRRGRRGSPRTRSRRRSRSRSASRR